MLSMIVPTFDRVDKLNRCLSTLMVTHRGKADFEVIVVLDGGPRVEETKAVAKKHGAKFVHLQQNSGCCYANNAGIKAASKESDCVIVMNDDIWFENAACVRLSEFMRTHPRVGVTGAKLLYPDGTVQHAGLDTRVVHVGRHLPGNHPLVCEDRSAIAVTSALMCISKKFLNVVGGFDDRYRMGYEDVDLCFKARDMGWLTYYCGSAWAYHDEGGTRGKVDQLQQNKVWWDWNSGGHRVFFSTWSSSAPDFCYDSMTYVVHASGEPLLASTLSNLAQQMVRRDEVIIVDTSRDGVSAQPVHARGWPFRYIHRPGARWQDAMDTGVRNATGCYIAFLREGDVYAPGGVAAIKSEIRKHPIRPILFRAGTRGSHMWAKMVVEPGCVSTQMIVIPNCPDFFGQWGLAVDEAAYVTDVQSRWPKDSMVWSHAVVA